MRQRDERRHERVSSRGVKAAEKEAKMLRTQRRELMGVARRRQRDVLCDVMLSARQCETWLTLDELSKLTHYPPASISAQLRHLRKPEYGGFAVEKRQRAAGRTLRGEGLRAIWGYPIKKAGCREFAGARLRGGGRQKFLQHGAWWFALASRRGA